MIDRTETNPSINKIGDSEAVKRKAAKHNKMMPLFSESLRSDFNMYTERTKPQWKVRLIKLKEKIEAIIERISSLFSKIFNNTENKNLLDTDVESGTSKSSLNESIQNIPAPISTVPQIDENQRGLPWIQRYKNLNLGENNAPFDKVKEFIDSSTDEELRQTVNTFGSTLLHIIAKIGAPIESVALLHQRGVDFNQLETGTFKNTPLIWAICNAKNEMAMELLKYDQNIDIKGNGNTALHLAIVKGYKNITADGDPLTVSNLTIVKRLIEKKANLEIKNNEGFTALHLACLRRDPEMIEALINAGADVNAVTNDGKTCEELINLSYQHAYGTLYDIAYRISINPIDYELDRNACLELIRPQTQLAE